MDTFVPSSSDKALKFTQEITITIKYHSRNKYGCLIQTTHRNLATVLCNTRHYLQRQSSKVWEPLQRRIACRHTFPSFLAGANLSLKSVHAYICAYMHWANSTWNKVLENITSLINVLCAFIYCSTIVLPYKCCVSIIYCSTIVLPYRLEQG